MVSATITHPYVTTAVAGTGSTPHNLLSGMAFADDEMGGLHKKWVSESDRAFPTPNMLSSKAISATGVRSECVQFLG